MNSAVLECLENTNGNYVLPFFWQHGESEEVLREYVRAIYNANIKEMCLEARPHPDYAGEGWFHDVDIILDEAKKHDMKLWILDDAHFPSGQAAGKMADAPDDMCKQFLMYKSIDTVGPRKQVMFDIGKAARYYDNPFAPKSVWGGGEPRKFSDDELFAVIAARLDGQENDIYHLDGDVINLTDKVVNGQLIWDVPEGNYRVLVIYKTRNGGGRSGYVNFLSKKSCRLQIEACYEPHYEHYKDEFGKTILGFFSDEPEIGNVSGYSGADAAIGNHTMPLPWSEEMDEAMTSYFGSEYKNIIPALWFNVGDDEFTAKARVGFMDIVSDLCKKNFGMLLGEWCREKGVKYIGHIVEDNNNSTKLGSSQGHYFRALWGQDWAGIDDIGGQVIEGGADISHQGLFNFNGDGEFYHHVLGRLGTSLADIDPKKSGNSMCEIFGAYGWGEGTRLMKYELDHFLVRGINHFVPHAFDPKDFPDPDCPPHFYAHGHNPLYKPFGDLMKYTNRIAHLISGGIHTAEVAVLYHAEAEWSGQGYMDAAKVARKLDEAQIDFDIIPVDALKVGGEYDTVLDSDELKINGHTFKILVIPGMKYLPDQLKEFLTKASDNRFKVVFVDFAPDTLKNIETVALSEVADVARNVGISDPFFDQESKDIRIYNYKKGNEKYYLVSNESTGRDFKGTIKIKGISNIFSYNAMKNRLEKLEYAVTSDGVEVELEILPYQMLVLVSGDETALTNVAKDIPIASGLEKEILGKWSVSFTDNKSYPEFKEQIEMTELKSFLLEKPFFSGIIKYETDFEADDNPKYLTIEDAFESAEVWVNDEYAGNCLCPPYRYEVASFVKPGTNHLKIEVRTTLERQVYEMTGGMGFLGPDIKAVNPEGIVGCIKLLY